MWISEEEASIRIGSHKNILNRLDRDSRPEGDGENSLEPETPPPDAVKLDPEVVLHVNRALNGVKQHLTQKEAADAILIGQVTSKQNSANLYGVNKDHIRLMTAHETQSHADLTPNTNLSAIIETQRTKIRDLAYKRLNTVLECLDEPKIKKVEKARELAVIGNQLAMISDKMLPKEMSSEQTVHFHMYRPEVKKESDYETVEVGEVRQELKLLEGTVTEAKSNA